MASSSMNMVQRGHAKQDVRIRKAVLGFEPGDTRAPTVDLSEVPNDLHAVRARCDTCTVDNPITGTGECDKS